MAPDATSLEITEAVISSIPMGFPLDMGMGPPVASSSSFCATATAGVSPPGRGVAGGGASPWPSSIP